jgi:arylsulfatase
LIDLMATCMDVARAAYPAQVGGELIHPPEGTSLVPAFTGNSWTRSSPLYWEHEGNRAMRDGKWKLVANGPRGPWELYDVEVDRSEMHDLAGQFPDRVAGMKEQWEAWSRRVGVQPWPVTRTKPN